MLGVLLSTFAFFISFSKRRTLRVALVPLPLRYEIVTQFLQLVSICPSSVQKRITMREYVTVYIELSNKYDLQLIKYIDYVNTLNKLNFVHGCVYSPVTSRN